MEAGSHKIKVTGRPVKAVKREVRASIRFTKLEYHTISEKAGSVGMKPTAYLRHLGIHATISTRLTAEEREIARNLIGVANNINQLTQLAHIKALEYLVQPLQKLRADIGDLVDKLFND